MKRLLAVVILTAVIVVGVAAIAQAANPNPRVIPPNANAYGATYEQWAERWYAWALSYPSELNPWADPTVPDNPFGTHPDYGQSGKVWFLAGNFKAGTYIRGTLEVPLTVPAGKALFFPLLNNAYFGFATDPPMSDSDIDWLLEYLASTVVGQPVTCEIDGVPVVSPERYTVQTAKANPFQIALPTDNLFGFLPEWLPLSPCWQVGTYLLLTPLSAGPHTIHFAAPDFPLDVTYNLMVAGGK